MKINVEFNTLGDMVNFADFVMNQSNIKVDKKKLEDYERMLANANGNLERAYERLRKRDEESLSPMLEKSIEEIEWTVRTLNCFKSDNIQTINQLVKLSGHQLLKIPNFGRKSLKEVRDELANLNLKLNGD
jgi:DNA-directed RNA polymerase subunit alpha